ncbi:DoxX family protein [Nocardia colli]|uniref:DoxX family protein n=1 Tax=Nocardia colli TaxID=2545717 RepID=A0A5N0EGK3_9NOCA|nr:DoxX family protein [Nocardia colli]KAA8888517.1 DoxX family protein [Nocardia colli]
MRPAVGRQECVGDTKNVGVSRQELIASGLGLYEGWPPPAIKGLGVLEVLAALGLILPAVTGIAPILVPLAATGLVLTMTLARGWLNLQGCKTFRVSTTTPVGICYRHRQRPAAGRGEPMRHHLAGIAVAHENLCRSWRVVGGFGCGRRPARRSRVRC